MTRWLLLVALVSAPAFGADAPTADTAESKRLQDEMNGHARRGRWDAVESEYRKLLALDAEPAAEGHALAAQAAAGRGDVLRAVQRWRRAVSAPSLDKPELRLEAEQSAAALMSQHRLTHITVGAGRLPALVRPEAPFNPLEQAAIAHAQEVLAQTRHYRGMLPIGDYLVDGERFTLTAGDSWQTWLVEPAPTN